MEASDLKIGNLVTDSSGFICEIREIRSGTVKVKYHSDKDIYCLKSFSEIFSIPLTEEWLFEFGFNKVRYEKYSHEKLNKLRAYPHVNKDGFGIYLMGSYTLPNIKHVHQLQNLYYALTKEEL